MRVLKFVSLILFISYYQSFSSNTIELKPSVFENELQAIRYDRSFLALASDNINEFKIPADSSVATEQHGSYKSPVKAMLLSFAIPGLGQYYYGSKIKSALFLGTEITAWTLHILWHNDGETQTDEFEAFNREHWLESRYEHYLELAYYGYTDDEDIPADSAEGIIHHLPNTMTQQYYEMTGKYDQFAWGWDDAVRGDSTLQDYTDSIPKIIDENTAPYSALRFKYETMRADANDKFDKANKMIMVAVINRIISGFEAYLMTRHKNKQNQSGSDVFSRIRVEAGLKSYYVYKDTPFFKMTYKF